jgi:tRNA dimethylallyltransferase
MSSKNKLIVLIGATAVGKTKTCVKVAQHWQTEIVYADSRQVYKELTIGTAKPTLEEQEGIPHHLVDCISIEQDYTAGQYELEALAYLNSIFEKNKVAVLSGGSGLYIKAVCEGLDDIPTDDTIRQSILEQFQKEGLKNLLIELEEKDKEYFTQIDKSNPQRIMRAVEVIRITSTPYSQLRTGEKKLRPFEILKIVLDRPREELYERINKRMDIMLENGLVKEVDSLRKYQYKNALQTVGYKEIFDFWAGKYDWSEAIRLLKQNSRHYAKRQLTWFRQQDKDAQWFHPENDWENILRVIKEFVEK